LSQINIEDLLSDMNIEFRNPKKAPGGWLPIECYDNKEMDTRAPLDWLKLLKGPPSAMSQNFMQDDNEGPQKPKSAKIEIQAQGLWQDRDGLCFWRKLKVTKYLPGSEKYQGFWENTKEVIKLPRIHILFDEEDPRVFA
jgi:hypothetical protein